MSTRKDLEEQLTQIRQIIDQADRKTKISRELSMHVNEIRGELYKAVPELSDSKQISISIASTFLELQIAVDNLLRLLSRIKDTTT